MKPGRRIRAAINWPGLLLGATAAVALATPAYSVAGPVEGRLSGQSQRLVTADWRFGRITPLPEWIHPTLSWVVTLTMVAIIVAERRRRRMVEADAATRTNTLSAASEQLKAILDASPIAIAGSDQRGIMNVWNRAAERMSGLKASDLIGRAVPDAVRDLSGEFGTKLDRVAVGEIIVGMEVLRRRLDGTVVETISSGAGVFDANGKYMGLVTATMDISAAREAQRARAAAEGLVQESEQRYRLTFDIAPIGIMHTAPDGQFLMVNNYLCDLLGYTMAELLAMNIYTVTEPEDVEATQVRYQRAMSEAGPIPPIVKRYRHRDNSLIWCEVTSSAERDDGGQARRFITIVNNITARRSAEEHQRKLTAQLQQAQRMEAIGQLTGGMAHDFNNLLGVILGNLGFLERKFAPGSDELDLTVEASTAAWRGAELVQSLLAFARRQPLAPKTTSLVEVLLPASRLLQRVLREDIALDVKLGDGLWPVLIDIAQLESAVLNLAVNARDAMPRGGTLTIEADNVNLDASTVDPDRDAAAGNYVVLSLSDTGAGMSSEVIAKVFEPFFTTKGSNGTGLGLSMVHGFVKQSGGHTRIYSEVGKGTTIKMFLPRAPGNEIEAEIKPPPRAAASGDESILIVEDNERLRNLVARQLKYLGYQAITAGDAGEALEIMRGDVSIDLLFTDVVLPGAMDGWALAKAAHESRDNLKVLFTSGFTAAAAAASLAREFGSGLLTKPYRADELAERVRAAIDGVA